MANEHPNPCDTCPECTCTNGCGRWHVRYHYRQKQINAFARKLVEKSAPQKQTVWRYPHPEEVKRYLAANPCDTCMCRSHCEQICKVRADWWEAHMAVLRRKLV